MGEGGRSALARPVVQRGRAGGAEAQRVLSSQVLCRPCAAWKSGPVGAGLSSEGLRVGRGRPSCLFPGPSGPRQEWPVGSP